VGESLLDSTTYRAIRVLAVHKAKLAVALQEFGLHLGQESMLAQLWREDGLTQSQLAERLGVSAPAITKVVRGLERDGLVRRDQDNLDARVLRVYLTEQGLALKAPVTAAWYAVESVAFAELTVEQQEALRQLAATSPVRPGA
jgi:DNA-binding MarR family transcriptional regulator